MNTALSFELVKKIKKVNDRKHKQSILQSCTFLVYTYKISENLLYSGNDLNVGNSNTEMKLVNNLDRH